MNEPDRISELEKAAHEKNINVSHIVRFYRDRFADQPLLHLIQDINQRVGIYSNILEEIKGLSADDEDMNATAKAIKKKYEKLQLVPSGNIPNPEASTIAKYLLDKIAVFGRALIEIMAKHASDIRREIRIEPSVTVLFQVEVGWSPKFILGVEGQGTRLRPGEQE
jgi:hypothetical protein